MTATELEPYLGKFVIVNTKEQEYSGVANRIVEGDILELAVPVLKNRTGSQTATPIPLADILKVRSSRRE